jgi:hypothetical protein
MVIECGIISPEHDYLSEKPSYRSEIKRPEGDYFTHDEICNAFEISPANLVLRLRKHRNIIKIYTDSMTREDRDWFYDDSVDPVECLSAFNDAKFHFLEVEALRLTGYWGRLAKIGEQNSSCNEDSELRIAKLENECAILKKEFAEANAQFTTKEKPPQTEEALTPQQKAALAKQEKTLDAWKPAIDAMIKVAVRCGEEGRKPRQQPELNTMFNELDAELTDTQMAFFRKSLPDEHIDREGGTRGKS